MWPTSHDRSRAIRKSSAWKKVFDPREGRLERASLVFAKQKINVRPKGADKVDWFTADHESPRGDVLCFLTPSTPDEVVAHLEVNGITIEEGRCPGKGRAAPCARPIAAIPRAA
jgi:hypothetical protein